MRRKASILTRSMILTFLLTLLLGSFVVHAEEEVRINHTNYTVNIGDEDNVLRLEMLNQKEGDKKPRWVSYNVNVATVDQDGVVTPLRKGKAIISSGIGFPRKTCVVTVVEPGVKLNKSEVTLYHSPSVSGNTLNSVTLTAKVNGAAKNAKDVVWSSSNASVAKVVPDNSGKGVVTPTDQAGTAVIIARANGRTATCKVTVLESSISLDVDSMQLSTRGAGSSVKLVPTVVGAKKAVTWTSSDPKTATVSGGKVTGKKAGEVTVTAAANGVEASCKVTVVEGQISINEEKVLLYVTEYTPGESAAETRELKTNAAANDAVTWTSSNEKVVKVVSKPKGKAAITAVGAGTAVITVTCNEKTDTCVVKVAETETSITEDDVHLKTKGDAKTYTLDYNVVGRKNAVWKSSNAKVVSVSKGKLTAKKAGSAIVTLNANGIEDKVRVIVTNSTAAIALNQREYTLYTKGKGNTVALKATVDGASKKVEWYSNASKVAAVDAKGRITAKAPGRALITAKANGVTAKCWVTVKEPKIILEKNELIIRPQDKVNLCEETSMEIIGESQNVTYKSTDAKTVAVDKKGYITAKKTGQAAITVTANGVSETCNVTVSECDTHNWGPEKLVRPAACEESGLSSKECSECNGIEQTVTVPLGHSFGKWTVAAKATENAAGLEKQVCTREGCNEENTRIIPAKSKSESAYGYKLEWEDDFNGDALNRNSWNVELHAPGWVNEEWQEYVDSTDNIYVKDGNLVIQAVKDGDKYTSGRINTQNKHDYQYGKFEVRAKVPNGKGFLPAFWMMPTDENYYGQWPKCGEIDVMEVLGDQTNKVHSTLHFGEPHTQQQGTYTLPKGNFSEDFHVYACEWDPGELRFYVDGILFYTVNDWFSQKPGFGKVAYPAPYDQPFYMILNLAVGGSWVGYPDENTQFGSNAQLVVDYVRVYQKDNYDDTDVEIPEKEVQLREPDASGNYIINGDFAKAEKLPTGENWKLLLAGEGKATAEIKNKELQITTENAGELNYSVQFVQADLPLEQGCKYKLSYEAYADEARTMITDISAPDRGYIRYLNDTTVNLTTEKQTFEHTFDMKSDSDANGRVEFNLGNQGSIAKVHITNVRLEKAGEAEEDVKGVLPDGNYVYNGSFDEGNEDGRLRLAYWDWDTDKCEGARVSVTRDAKRELKVVVPETVAALDDVAVYQKSIAIKGGKTYKLSFDAYADQAKTIKATIAGQTFESALTTEKKEYRYELKTAAELNGSELRFLLGVAGATYIDNISIREDGMIVNGDFSSGMTGYEVYVNDAAKVPGYTVDSLNEDSAFSIDIADTGAQDWYIQLKQNNIKLEEGKTYKIGFDAKSTVDRQIMYALQRDGSEHKTEAGAEDWTPYSGSQVIDLTGSYQTFGHTFKMTEGTDPETILSISMGAVGSKQISTKHTVVIDNIILEEADPVEIPPVEEGKEMILNGDFSEGEAHWKSEISTEGAAEVDFSQGKAVYKITSVGKEDYSIKLNHTEKLTLEAGASYKVKFKIKSTAARTVKYSFMTSKWAWYGGEDLSLPANEVKEVDYTMTVGNDGEGNPLATSDEITFAISMGKIAGEDTPSSTIEIDDISVKKIGGTGGEEPVEPVKPGTDLIKNGDFSKGKEDWTESGIYEDGKGTENFEGGKAVYEITNVGTQDWHIQLKQTGLTLEKDAKYKLSFKIKSTAARNVMYKLQDPENGYADYGTKSISLEANTEKTVEETITVEKESSKSIIFVIAMGKTGDGTIPTHTIEIDDVSLVKVGEEGDDPAIEIGTELIKNGKFEQGGTDWSAYFHEENGAAVAEGKPELTEGKARFEITNAGTEDWNVQLKQEGLKMEKGAKYKVNFKIGSSIDRKVKLAIMGASNAWCDGDTIDLKKDKQKSYSKIVTLNDNYVSGSVAFQISMGNYKEDEADKNSPTTKLDPHAIEMSDISVTKVAAETQADEVTETNKVITPPAVSGEKPDDPEKPDTGNLIKNGDFVGGETNWTKVFHEENGTAVAEGNATFTDAKARYEITNAGTADWNVQLKQEGLLMEKGAAYKVNFKIGSSINRYVKLAFMGSGDAWYGGDDIELTTNKLKSVSRIVTLKDEDIVGTLAFQLSMGNYEVSEGEAKTTTTLPSHAIEISDISVTKVATNAPADDETEDDVTIKPPAEPVKPDEPGTELIQNGNFSDGEAHWVNAVTAPGVAEATFTNGENGKATYEITDVGTEDYHIQLKHKELLTLEKGAEYTVKFNIESTKARTVKYAFLNPSYVWYGGEDLVLTADEVKKVQYTLKIDQDTSDEITFVISMGQIYKGEGDNKEAIDTPASTIKIDSISVIKVKETGGDTEEKGDTETLATPSENNSDDDEKTARDNQNVDNSNDMADDEDADSTMKDSEDAETSDIQDDSKDTEIPDGQNHSGNAEASDDQNGSGSNDISETSADDDNAQAPQN